MTNEQREIFRDIIGAQYGCFGDYDLTNCRCNTCPYCWDEEHPENRNKCRLVRVVATSKEIYDLIDTAAKAHTEEDVEWWREHPRHNGDLLRKARERKCKS